LPPQQVFVAAEAVEGESRHFCQTQEAGSNILFPYQDCFPLERQIALVRPKKDLVPS
jgi:hypothetical protein